MAKKDIEIPFGAKDSELCGWEYTIPDGMEATIVDNKIVVKKKESEDERIRGAIIDHLKDNNLTEWAAWLEKQGEHKKFRDSIQVGDRVTRNEDGVLVNLSQLNRVAKKDKKQGKQKDILEDAILDSNKDGLIADTIRYKREKRGEQKPADTEKGTKGNDREIPSFAWSEEDEEKVKAMCEEGNLKPSERQWLNSIKDRVGCEVNCTTTKEWSEENKRIIDRLCEILYDCHSYGKCSLKLNEYSNLYDWLKSLKPQNTWKPSDEQMKALDSAIHCYAGISSTNNREVYALEIMKEQLKKLREE